MLQIRRFNHLLSEIDAAYHDYALQAGMNDSTLMILYTLWLEDGACMLGDLLHMTGLSKQTANSALRALEAQGMVHSETIGLRRKKLHLSDAGKRASGAILHLIEIENEIYAGWTEAEQEIYMELTARYLRQFREKALEEQP